MPIDLLTPPSTPASLAYRRPAAGAHASRRARDAAFERAAIGGCLALAIVSSGFAAYTIADSSDTYNVQRILPASIGAFAWKKPVIPARTAAVDLDPQTTGSLPDPKAADPTDRIDPGVAARGYVLRRVSSGSALVEGPNGLRQIMPGAILPGAGRVVSIRSTGAGWVVVTSETIIGPAPL